MRSIGWTRECRSHAAVYAGVIAGLVLVSGCGGQAWSAPEVIEGGTDLVPSRWVGDQDTGEGVTLVRAAVEGATGWFLLDSGSEVMVLDRAFADSLALAAGASVSLGGCDLRGCFRGAERFRFGTLRFHDVRFLAFDLEPLLTDVADQARIVGVLGHPGLELPSVDVRFRLPGTEAARNEGTSFDGVMGRHLLRHFTLVLDFANQRVSLLHEGGVRE